MLEKRCSTASREGKKQKYHVTVFEESPQRRNMLHKVLSKQNWLKVTGAFEDFRDCRQHLKVAKSDIVIMDLQIKGKIRLSHLRMLKEDFPDVHFLVLSSVDHQRIVLESLSIGVSGYLMKDEPINRLIQALKDIIMGEVPMSPRIARHMLNYLQLSLKSSALSGLS